MTLTINQAIQRDPTRTATIRRRFRQALAKRFQRVARAVYLAVSEGDVLGLSDGPYVNRDLNLPTIAPRAFAFRTSGAKVRAFADWLEQMEEAEILQWFEVNGREYIDAAYKQGATQAQTVAAGATGISAEGALAVTFAAPIHRDAVELIYTRAFEDLKGITRAMSQRISRELAQGLAEGVSPLDMARRLAGKDGAVKKIGITRARTLARTEVIRAHAEATLNEYERFGLEEVDLEVELSVNADACPICKSWKNSNGIVSIQASRGVIPLHPNCRCSWKPVVK